MLYCRNAFAFITCGKALTLKSLQEKLHSINAALSSEYGCRRRMLIKRLDVTVQSFGWSDRAKVLVQKHIKGYVRDVHSRVCQSAFF